MRLGTVCLDRIGFRLLPGVSSPELAPMNIFALRSRPRVSTHDGLLLHTFPNELFEENFAHQDVSDDHLSIRTL